MENQVSVFQDIQLFVDIEKFTSKLNEIPNPKWLQKTPDGKADYIPVAIIENELRKDFAGLVQFTILSERRELNEYIVTARIEVFHPIVKAWLKYDGIGAVQIMQKKDTELAAFAEHKIKNALGKDAPKSYAEAIKNAAKKIGIKYGANVNRKFEEAYEPEYTLQQTLEEVTPLIKKCETNDDLVLLWDTYTELHTSNKFKFLFTTRKGQIAKGK